MITMTMDEAHEYEDALLEDIKLIDEFHPILNKYFGSTWEAIDAYEKILRVEKRSK